MLQRGRTGAAAHRGRAGGLAVAELELEATHAYALIMSLGSSLPMRPRNCKLKREAGLNSARSTPPCCCSCHCSSNCDAAAGIIFFAAWARKTHQQWKWVDLHKTITQIQGGNYNSMHPQVHSWCCSGIACGRCSGPRLEGWLWPSSMPCQLYSLEQLMLAPH